MNNLFYRENLYSKRKLLNIFSKKSEKIFNDFDRLEEQYVIAKEEILSTINSQINSSKKTSGEIITLLKLRKRIHKDKKPTQDQLTLPIAKSYFDMFTKYNQKKSELLTKINDLYIKQETLLLTSLKKKDVVLSRNKRIKHLIFSNNKVDQTIKSKDILSFYGLVNQLALKTGAFGLTGRVGLISSGRFKQPNHALIVRVQGYLMARLYKKYLVDNLEKFTGTLLINTSYKLTNDKYIFDVLVDNDNASLFLNTQKKVVLSKNKFIDKLIGLNKGKSQDFLNLLNKEQIRELIELGIILYEGIDDEINFEVILNQFRNLPVATELKRMSQELNKLNNSFNVNAFEQLDTELTEFFENNGIPSLNQVTLTVDSFIRSRTDCSNKVFDSFNRITGIQGQLQDAAKFFSTIDASYYAKKIAYEYVQENYPEGIKLSSSNLHPLLHQISNFINQNMNIGKVRTGFDNTLLCNELFKSFDLNKPVIIDNCFLTKYFQKVCPSKYHSYSMFLQENDGTLVLNHVYKGYGTFVRRFWDNYSVNEKNINYGLSNLYDIPYNFGFNASYRKSLNKAYLGFLPHSSIIKRNSNESNLKISDITVYPDKRTKNLLFLDNNENKINLSYLGSLNPIAYPAMLLELNTITLNSSLYFDLGDLVLRKLYQKEPDKRIYRSPEIFFENKSLLIARQKTLISSKKILNAVNNKDNLLEVYRLLITLLDNSSFFVREFIVDFAKFNRRMTKPMFVDLRQPVSIKAFLQYLKNVEWVVLEKSSPDVFKNLDEKLCEFIYTTNISSKEGEQH